MAWKKLAFTDEVLTNPMTADLDMGGNNISKCSLVQADGLTGYTEVRGGTAYPASMIAYGENHALYPGDVRFYIPNAAKTNWLVGLIVNGVTNTPTVTIPYGLDMNSMKITSIATGTDAADAIRKDQALLLVGTQAMQGDLNFNKHNADAMCIQPLASAPSTPGTAQVYYNTGDDHLYVNAV